MENITLIGSEEVLSIPILDDNEPFVDFLIDFPDIIFEKEAIEQGSHFGRKKIGEMLRKAQALLPSDEQLLIRCCYRHPSIQKKHWETRYKDLKNRFPEYNGKQLYERCSKIVAPISVAPHCTGGAVDVLIVGKESGESIDFGNHGTTFTYDKSINDYQRLNRQKLINVMSSVGFVNYPTEWWHWSYGDRYWAFVKNKNYAIYGIKNH